MSTIRLQAEISGYSGKAANLLGALDTESGLLIIAKELKHGERQEDALMVSNDPRAEHRDTLFTEDMLQEAIHLYFRGKSTGMVELISGVTKHDPVHKIENDGINERGTKYRLAPDITNGQVAVLALMSVSNATSKAQDVADFSAELADMFMSI